MENNKVLDILKKHNFRFKKKWGQNFITDKNLLQKIVQAAQIKPDDEVIEIGPGAGTLTKVLAEAEARVLAVEIDKDLIPVLKENLADLNVKIVQGDILQRNLDELACTNNFTLPYKIVANLPYYITTPIIMNILENEYNFELMTIMVQREVAERLTALPGKKEYGAITLAIEYYCEAQIVCKVSRYLFKPTPNVDSAVLVLKRRQQPPVDVYNEELMFKIIKAAFGQRRKTLLNALCNAQNTITKSQIIDILEKTGIKSQRRGETLSLQEFCHLANRWQEFTKN